MRVKLFLIAILVFLQMPLWAQKTIEGVSPSVQIYFSPNSGGSGGGTVDPCSNENPRVILNSYPAETFDNEVTVSGYIANVKKGVASIIITNTSNGSTVFEMNKTNFNKQIPLTKGINNIKITYTTLCGKSGEKTFSVNKKSGRKDYALFFVVSEPKGGTAIPNALSEAERLATVLKQYYGFETEIVQNPTRQDLLTTLKKYKNRQYNDNDQLLVYLVTHGAVTEFSEYLFLFADGGLNQSAFRKSLDNLPVNHILFIANTCYSSADLHLSDYKPQISTINMTGEQIAEQILSKDKTRKIIAAGPELVPAGFQTSPLVERFVEYLTAHRNEKIITIQQLGPYVTGLKYPNGTSPLYTDFGSDGRSSTFVFIPKK